MLSGYDFSNFSSLLVWLVNCWSEGSPKNSLKSKDRKLFWERQCSEEEATQSECNSGWIRSEFLLHTEVLMGKQWWQTEISHIPEKQNSERCWRTKSRWRLSVRWLFRPWRGRKQKHTPVTASALSTWHETWGQPVQPVQPVQHLTATSARRGCSLIQVGGREDGVSREQTCAEV